MLKGDERTEETKNESVTNHRRACPVKILKRRLSRQHTHTHTQTRTHARARTFAHLLTFVRVTAPLSICPCTIACTSACSRPLVKWPLVDAKWWATAYVQRRIAWEVEGS